MWKSSTAFIFLFSLSLFTVSSAPSPASLPLPGLGHSLGSESRQAIKAAISYHDSEDGVCSLPLPAGFCIKSRLVKGGTSYDGIANRVIRRPDEVVTDFCQGARTVAMVQQLQAGVFPRETIEPEDVLRRVVSDYLTEEVLENGKYCPVRQNEVSTFNGVPRVRTLLKSPDGRNKLLSYSIEYLAQDTGPALVLTVKEREDTSTTYHGFVAKSFGDQIVAGYARFLLAHNLSETEAQIVLACIAGIRVKQPEANPEMEKAVIGTWESTRVVAPSDARYIFGPDGRFAKTVKVRGTHTGRGSTEPGDYRVFGNLISLRYDKDEVVSLPVQVEGNLLSLGGQEYARVKK